MMATTKTRALRRRSPSTISDLVLAASLPQVIERARAKPSVSSRRINQAAAMTNRSTAIRAYTIRKVTGNPRAGMNVP